MWERKSPIDSASGYFCTLEEFRTRNVIVSKRTDEEDEQEDRKKNTVQQMTSSDIYLNNSCCQTHLFSISSEFPTIKKWIEF